ncbi:DUF4238 domain-containing protein [Brevundimonas sp. M1A4_2e]
MSGKKQHFIPQSLLRGFETETRTGHRLWVHHRNRGTFEANVQDVAASRFFYSEPRAEGAPETLDDQITAYESRLADLLKWLKVAPEGNSSTTPKLGRSWRIRRFEPKRRGTSLARPCSRPCG